jgi:hypothetical protein
MSAGNKTGFESTIETMITYSTCIGFDATSASSVSSFSVMWAAWCVEAGPAILTRFSAGR